MNTETTADAAPTPAPPPKALCANCGAELLGPHCYACGQPVKGMVRHLGSIMHDVADTILNIDSRIFRTLLPLYLRPGYLSNEYFAGRRVRYVTPFRLYFFLSVAAFLLIQVGLDASLDKARDMVHLSGAVSDIANAQNAGEVERLRDAEIARLEAQRAQKDVDADTLKTIEGEERQVRKQADKRLAKLAARASAAPPADAAPPTPGAPPAAAPQIKQPANPSEVREAVREAVAAAHARNDDDSENINFEIDGKPWDPKTHPVHVDWLPEFLNAKINAALQRMKDNVARIKQDPKPFLLDTFGVLPQVLFVLMPLFALLLKIFFIFKRRLYMEHLIVALHSHSFIFLSLSFITLTLLARGWARSAAPWLEGPLGLLLFVMWWWLPIYLFLMQKKVYKQGWFFTSLKFSMIGICYMIMISLGIAAAAVVSLASGR